MYNNLEILFYKLSLKNQENTWKEIISNSLPSRLFLGVIGFLKRFLEPLARESYAARFSEAITMFSLMFMVFVSPFVSTEMNAALVIFAVLATTLKHFLKPETIPEKTDILTFTVIAYFAIGLVAAGFSPYFTAALKGFAKTIIFFLAYLVFLVNLTSFKNIRLVLWAIVISAGIVAAYGDYQFYIKVEPYQGALWDDPTTTNYRLTRVYSFLKNPNLLAGYLIPVISLTAAFLYLKHELRQRLIIAGSLALQIPCLYFTYSRQGWFGMVGIVFVIFTGSMIIFKLYKSKVGKWAVLGILILGLLGMAAILIKSPATRERVRTIFTVRGNSSNSFRMNVWISSFNMLKDNLIIGIGPGNTIFEKIYPLYMFSGFKALSAYNIFLETAIETGIIGLLIFLFMLVSHSCRCIWGIIADIDYSSRVILMGCLAGLTGLMVQGLFDTVWYRPQVNIFVWLMLAVITIVSRDEMALKRFNESDSERKVN
jgi:putative inorganic carbon (HCO3(-)) transporter